MSKEKKPIICIYKITSPSKKIYIGQTRDFVVRLKEHHRSVMKNRKTLLCNSFKKYGVSRHKIEVLHYCNENELNELERYYIELYQTFENANGLNLTNGGEGHFLSEETKEKLRRINTGRKSSAETCRKISESNKGKRHTKESILRMRVAQKGRTFTDATKKKMSEVHKGKKWTETMKKNFILVRKGKTTKKAIPFYLNGVLYRDLRSCMRETGRSNTYIIKHYEKQTAL